MTVSVWQTNAELEGQKADLVVVGAGIAGLSVAYWFRQQNPKARILILDKGEVGSGATGRNAGFVTCGSVGHFKKLQETWGPDHALQVWRFSEMNHQLLCEKFDLENAKVDYLRRGSLSLASTPEAFAELEITAEQMKSAGLAVERLDPSTLSAYGLKSFSGAIRYAKDGRIHPLKLMQRLLTESNAELIPLTEVVQAQSDGSLAVLKTSRGIIKAQRVALCLNGYAGLFNDPRIPKITPNRGQVLVTEPVSIDLPFVCYAREALCYFRQLPDKSILIGGFRHLDPQTETTYVDQVNSHLHEQMLEFLGRHLNLGSSLAVAKRWSGMMGFSEDERPKVHHLDAHVSFVGGFSGHGMGLAFHLAKVLVENWQGQPLPQFLSAANKSKLSSDPA